MTKEKDILMLLENNSDISQRELAKKAGISLGTVNYLLKKCVKKGLLKIERLNSRNLKYILTPAGMKEKMKRTLSFVKRSYKAIIQLQDDICRLAKEKKKQDYKIWIMGEKDEIYEIVVHSLKRNNIDFSEAQKKEDITITKDQKTTVIYWDVDNIVMEKQNDIEYINLLKVSKTDIK